MVLVGPGPSGEPDKGKEPARAEVSSEKAAVHDG